MPIPLRDGRIGYPMSNIVDVGKVLLVVGLWVHCSVNGFPTTPSTEQSVASPSTYDEPQLTAIDAADFKNNNFQRPFILHYIQQPPLTPLSASEQADSSHSAQQYTVNALHTSAAWLAYIQQQQIHASESLHNSINVTWAGITDSKHVQNLPTSRDAKWKDLSSLITPMLLDGNNEDNFDEDVQQNEKPIVSVSLCRPTIRVFVTTHPDITAHAAAAAAADPGPIETANKKSENFVVRQPHPDRDDMCFVTILSSRAQTNNISEISKVHAHRLPSMTQLARRGVIYFIHIPYRWLFLPGSQNNMGQNQSRKSNNVDRTRASLDIKYAVTSCSAIFSNDEQQHNTQRQRQEDDWSENSKITTITRDDDDDDNERVVAHHQHPALSNLNQIQLGSARVEQLCVQSSETAESAAAQFLDDGSSSSKSDSEYEDDNQIEDVEPRRRRVKTLPDETSTDCRSSCQTQQIVFHPKTTKTSLSSHHHDDNNNRRAKRHFKMSPDERQQSRTAQSNRQQQKQQIDNGESSANFIHQTRERTLYVEMPSPEHDVAVGERFYVGVYLREQLSVERRGNDVDLRAFTLKIEPKNALRVVGIGEFFQHHEKTATAPISCKRRRGEWRFSAEKHSQRSLSVTAVEIPPKSSSTNEISCEGATFRTNNYPLFVFIMERASENEEEQTADSTELIFTLSYNTVLSNIVEFGDDDEEARTKQPRHVQTVHVHHTRVVRLARANGGGQTQRPSQLVVNIPRTLINTAVLSSPNKKQYFPVFLYAVDCDNNVFPLHKPASATTRQHEYEVQCNTNNHNIKILSSASLQYNYCSRLLLDGRETRGGITQIQFRLFRKQHNLRPTTESFRSDKLLTALQAELEKWHVPSSSVQFPLQTVRIPIKIWFPEFPVKINVSSTQIRPIENWRRHTDCADPPHKPDFEYTPVKIQCVTRFMLTDQTNNKHFLLADDVYIDITHHVLPNVRLMFVDSANKSDVASGQFFGSSFVPTHLPNRQRLARFQFRPSQHSRRKVQHSSAAGESETIILSPSPTQTQDRRRRPSLFVSGMQAELFTGLQSLVVAERTAEVAGVARRASDTADLGDFTLLRVFVTPQLLSSSTTFDESGDILAADFSTQNNVGVLAIFVKLLLKVVDDNGKISRIDLDKYDPTAYRLHVKYFFVAEDSNQEQHISWWHRSQNEQSRSGISLKLDVHRKIPIRLVFSMFAQQQKRCALDNATAVATANVMLRSTFARTTENDEQNRNLLVKFKILTPISMKRRENIRGLRKLSGHSKPLSSNEHPNSGHAGLEIPNRAETSGDSLPTAYAYTRVVDSIDPADRYVYSNRVAHSVTIGLAIIVMLSACLAAIAWITCSRSHSSTPKTAIVVLAKSKRKSRSPQFDDDENDDEADDAREESVQRIGSLCCSSSSVNDTADDDESENEEEQEVHYSAIRCFGGKIYRKANRRSKRSFVSQATVSSTCGEDVAYDESTSTQCGRLYSSSQQRRCSAESATPAPVLPRMIAKPKFDNNSVGQISHAKRLCPNNKHCATHKVPKSTSIHSIVSSSTSLAKEWVWLGRNAVCNAASAAADAVGGSGNEVYTRLRPVVNETNTFEKEKFYCLDDTIKSCGNDDDRKSASFDEVESMRAVLENLDIFPAVPSKDESQPKSSGISLFDNPVADTISSSAATKNDDNILPVSYDAAETAVAAHFLYNIYNPTGSLFTRAHQAQQLPKNVLHLQNNRGHKSQPTSPAVLPRFGNANKRGRLPAPLLVDTHPLNGQQLLALSRETKLC